VAIAKRFLRPPEWRMRGEGERCESDGNGKAEYSYFLTPVCLLASDCVFACEALLVLACFCEDFFWFALGDLSPMILVG
jgi:hypothetical protein